MFVHKNPSLLCVFELGGFKSPVWAGLQQTIIDDSKLQTNSVVSFLPLAPLVCFGLILTKQLGSSTLSHTCAYTDAHTRAPATIHKYTYTSSAALLRHSCIKVLIWTHLLNRDVFWRHVGNIRPREVEINQCCNIERHWRTKENFLCNLNKREKVEMESKMQGR